jgi:hypothetical protein
MYVEMATAEFTTMAEIGTKFEENHSFFNKQLCLLIVILQYLRSG